MNGHLQGSFNNNFFRTKGLPWSSFFLQRSIGGTQNYFPGSLPSLDLFLIQWQESLFKYLCFLPGEKKKNLAQVGFIPGLTCWWVQAPQRHFVRSFSVHWDQLKYQNPFSPPSGLGAGHRQGLLQSSHNLVSHVLVLLGNCWENLFCQIGCFMAGFTTRWHSAVLPFMSSTLDSLRTENIS